MRNGLPSGMRNSGSLSSFLEDSTPAAARKLTLAQLANAKEDRGPDPYRSSLIAIVDAEIRRRDAWAAPAGRAIWISAIALAVSFAAFMVSMAGR